MNTAKLLEADPKGLFRHAPRLFATIVALVPFVCVFTVDYTLRQEGWPVWSSGIYVTSFISMLIGAWFWARHFWYGTPWLRLTSLLLAGAFVWTATRTDWIVETQYEYMGKLEQRTFTPPVRPIWDPPHPQQLSETATSWRDMDFFYIGGAGGPTEEPVLRINWVLVYLKLTLVTVLGYLFVRILASIDRRFRSITVA